MKFTLTAKVVVDVTAVIEADSIADAEEILDSADCCVECCDGDITFSECCQSNSEIEETKWHAADKWESMDKLERASVLKDKGVDVDEALEAADKDYLNEIDEDWWEHFDA